MQFKSIILILVLILLIGCVPPPPDVDPIQPVEEVPEEPQPTCTERWVCQGVNTRAYRKSDCSFEQIKDCPAGCENGNCKTPVVETQPEEPALEEPETEEETKERCEVGWACLDEKRRGYRSTVCMFNQVDECEYGCKDGKCIREAPPEEEIEETFSLTQGTGKFDMPGWRFFDFDNELLFEKEADVNDRDIKLKLYSSAIGNNHYRVESPRDKLWIIEKGITEATRSDCVENRIGKEDAFGYLKSDKTVCLETREKDIALIGGTWDGLPSEDTELTWKYYTLIS